MVDAKQIKAGIVGYGLSGSVFHAPFLEAMEEFKLISVVERHSDTALDEYPDVKICRDYRELLQDPLLDLIVICTPNTTHFSMARDCLGAGKHVVVDKPFVPTAAQADQLIKISEETGKKIFVYQNRRLDGDFRTIRKLIEQGTLGDILEYEAHFDRFRPEVPLGKWREGDKPGGGLVYDLGSHLIDQALVLFGMPEAVFADIRAQREKSKVDDYFSIQLFYPRHTAVLKAGMFARTAGPRYKIHGREASYVKYGLDPQEALLKKGMKPLGTGWGLENEEYWGMLSYHEDGQLLTRKLETEPGAYQDFYRNVHDVLVHGTEPLIRPLEAAEVISIIELAFESSAAREVRKIR
jgi:predicted dehydrogenase